MKKRKFRFLIVMLSSLVTLNLVLLNPASAKPMKACGNSGLQGGRVLQNVICKDGSPNRNAKTRLVANTPVMMKLKRSSTFHEIYLAICKDWKMSTGPDLMVTYDFLRALHDWQSSQYLDVYRNYPDCEKY